MIQCVFVWTSICSHLNFATFQWIHFVNTWIQSDMFYNSVLIFAIFFWQGQKINGRLGEAVKLTFQKPTAKHGVGKYFTKWSLRWWRYVYSAIRWFFNASHLNSVTRYVLENLGNGDVSNSASNEFHCTYDEFLPKISRLLIPIWSCEIFYIHRFSHKTVILGQHLI